MARVLIPLADGVEEMEAVIITDTLRRAGWDVDLAAVDEIQVTASRGVRLAADVKWQDVTFDDYDVLLIPGGGGGAERLRHHDGVLDAARRLHRAGKYVGAICAGPTVLQAAGILEGRSATCYPAMWEKLTAAKVSRERVVVDENIVTSQGPGTAFAFALKVIELVDGPEAMRTVADAMLVVPPSHTAKVD